MQPLPPTIAEVREILAAQSSFLICGHEDLDGDCLGSQLALFLWLKQKGKQVVVVSDGPTMETFTFLPGFDQLRRQVPRDFAAEVTLCVDTGSRRRVLPGVRLQGLIVNIDHHAGNTEFGDVNWVDSEAAAVGEMIYTLLEDDPAALTPDVAACLYLAILTDTGAFRFANTSARTFEIATALVRAGADPHGIANAYYDNIHPDTVRITGEILSNLHFELQGRLVWGEITHDVYQRLGGPERQPEQLASRMRSIQGVEVAALFHENDGSGGRVSLRSRSRVDVGALATELGGGGHPSAAGCRFQGDYTANRDRILDALRRHVAGLPPSPDRR